MSKTKSDNLASTETKLRLQAEQQYAEELAELIKADDRQRHLAGRCPPGP
ncbi:MAG: hypothetical protein QM703_16425 [Gemmatales bacterium]